MQSTITTFSLDFSLKGQKVQLTKSFVKKGTNTNHSSLLALACSKLITKARTYNMYLHRANRA